MDTVNIGKTWTQYDQKITLSWFQLLNTTGSYCPEEFLMKISIISDWQSQKYSGYSQNMAKIVLKITPIIEH